MDLQSSHNKLGRGKSFENIPTDYFETLHQKVMERIELNAHSSVKPIQWHRFAAAAVILLLTVGSVILLTNKPFQKNNHNQVVELSNATTDEFELLFEAAAADINLINDADYERLKFEADATFDEEYIIRTTLVSDLKLEEIINYLIEKEEFEF